MESGPPAVSPAGATTAVTQEPRQQTRVFVYRGRFQHDDECVSPCTQAGLCSHKQTPVRSSTVAPRPSKRETGAPGCRAGQVTPVQGCNRSPLWPGPARHPTPGFKPSFPAIKELSGSSVDNQVVSLQGGGLRGPAGMVRRAFAWGRDSVLGPSADFCSTRESGLWSLWVEQEDAALTRLI